MRRATTEKEKALWLTAMRDARAWRRGAPVDEPVPPVLPATVPPPAAPAAPRRISAPLVQQVDGATAARLRRGQIAIDGRIDLHGMDQHAAFGALMGFLDMSIRTGRRFLLVITGKGSPREGGGVLRRNAPAWLAASPFGARILTVTPAHLRHGGDGALYVILRRER